MHHPVHDRNITPTPRLRGGEYLRPHGATRAWRRHGSGGLLAFSRGAPVRRVESKLAAAPRPLRLASPCEAPGGHEESRSIL